MPPMPPMTGMPPGMPGMPAGGGGYGTGSWVFITGYSAAKLGDTATAERAAAQLKATGERIESSGDAYAAKPFRIMEKELGAVTRFAQGGKDEGV
jgi:hypothetical protein